jgi:hypothetical protein
VTLGVKIGALLLGALVLASCDRAPDAAADISGLALPAKVDVKFFRTNSARLGSEGHTLILLQLDSTGFAQLTGEAATKGYKRLPASMGEYYTRLKPYFNKSSMGWYMVTAPDAHDSSRFKLAILDARAKTLLAEEIW